MSSQTTTYLKLLRDIKKKWHSIPILARSLCLAGSLWGTTWLVPSLIFREDYLGLAVDPASFPQIGFVLGHILLGTVPVFAIWLWFPKETSKFAKSLSPFVICRTTDKLVVCRKWHFPFSVALVTVVMIGFLQALSRDTIVEWFEVLGWWGWSFPAILFGAQGVVITNALLAIRQFNIWFKKEVNLGLMVQPLHHDGRGGLRFIADTLWRLIWFAVTLGFWLILFNLQNIFSNNQGRLPNWYSIDLRLYVHAGFIFSVYVYFIWGFLLVPYYVTHSAMLKGRDRILQNISSEFSSTLNRARSHQGQNLQQLQALWAEYSFIKDVFPISPFSRLGGPGIQILAGLPPFLGLVLSVIQILLQLRYN